MATPHQQNASLTPEKSLQTPHKSVCVRLTLEQHQRVKGDAKVLGKSIPDMLRDAFFKCQVVVPLLSADDAKGILVALTRIGNNINQIARRVNAGFGSGLDRAITGMTDEFGALNDLLMANSAVRQARA